MERNHYVYILKCNDETLYTGYTTDVEGRIEKHTIGKGAKYTKGRGPFVLEHLESYSSKSEALKREYQIKQLSREGKWQLIKEGEHNANSY